MDRLIVKDIEFIGHCGVTEEERSVGQRISADIEVTVDISKAVISDRLQDSVDYVDMCNRVVSIGSKEKCNLLETLAGRIAKEILDSYNVAEVLIRLRKCSVRVDAIKGYFEVEVTRKRSPGKGRQETVEG